MTVGAGERVVRDAADLRRLPVLRALVRAPRAFSGRLDELYHRFVEPNLPAAALVADFHGELVRYVRVPDPLLLVRHVRGMERRGTYRTRDGTRLRATDNAPAWWVHYALVQGVRVAPGEFARTAETIPAHLFDVARATPDSASVAGWHVAHIFNVKDGDVGYERWPRGDAVRRFVRNVHPCNYFLLPKAEWRHWGGDARVLAYFAAWFAERYADVWREFLDLAGAEQVGDPIGEPVGDPIVYAYGEPERSPPQRSALPQARACVRASYEASRLLFKRAVIDALDDGDAFRVMTPHGTFEMTRRDVSRVFPNVLASESYRTHGVYHYRIPPTAALVFLLKPDD